MTSVGSTANLTFGSDISGIDEEPEKEEMASRLFYTIVKRERETTETTEDKSLSLDFTKRRTWQTSLLL